MCFSPIRKYILIATQFFRVLNVNRRRSGALEECKKSYKKSYKLLFILSAISKCSIMKYQFIKKIYDQKQT